MTVFHTKAADITSRDAVPPVRVSAGKGEAVNTRSVEAYATPTASAGIDTTIQLVRVPFSAIIKRIVWDGGIQDTSGKFDIGAYYATDGSNALSAASLLAADAIDQDFFTILELDSGAMACYADLIPGGGLRITNATPSIDANTVWTKAMANMPLWEALGLSANPGGNCDIVATVVEAPGAATTPVFIRVEYAVGP